MSTNSFLRIDDNMVEHAELEIDEMVRSLAESGISPVEIYVAMSLCVSKMARAFSEMGLTEEVAIALMAHMFSDETLEEAERILGDEH